MLLPDMAMMYSHAIQDMAHYSMRTLPYEMFDTMSGHPHLDN